MHFTLSKILMDKIMAIIMEDLPREGSKSKRENSSQ